MFCAEKSPADSPISTPVRTSFSRSILKQKQTNAGKGYAESLSKPLLDLDASIPHTKVVRFSPSHTTYETHSPDVYNRGPHEVVLDPNVVLKRDGRLCDDRPARRPIPRLQRARLTRHIEESRPSPYSSPSPRQRMRAPVQNVITEEEEPEDDEDVMPIDPLPAPVFTAISEEDESEESETPVYALTEMQPVLPTWKSLASLPRLDTKQHSQYRRGLIAGPQWSSLAHRRSIRTE